MTSNNPASEKKEAAFTVEMIIDLIRSTRITIVKEFLTGDKLNRYFQEKFGKELSTIKKEFIKRDLQSLLIIPMDLAYFGGLIRKLKEENARTISEENYPVFLKEIESILDRYNH